MTARKPLPPCPVCKAVPECSFVDALGHAFGCVKLDHAVIVHGWNTVELERTAWRTLCARVRRNAKGETK